MNILILVNKDFEYAGYRSGIEYQMTAGRTPHLHVTSRRIGKLYDNFEPSCEYELETDTGINHSVREYCISYLFASGDNSSNSELKYKKLTALFAKLESEKWIPDRIISVSTSESTLEVQDMDDKKSVNGCIFMGNRFFAVDCSEMDEPPRQSCLIPDKYNANEPIFDAFYDRVQYEQEKLITGMQPLPNARADELFCIASDDFISLGVINIVNYERYKIADRYVYETFKNDPEYKEYMPIGLETTHAVVKMIAPKIPVLFVSPIVDRYLNFDVDVDGKWGNQNRVGSSNAGVVVANMLEEFRNYFSPNK